MKLITWIILILLFCIIPFRYSSVSYVPYFLLIRSLFPYFANYLLISSLFANYFLILSSFPSFSLLPLCPSPGMPSQHTRGSLHEEPQVSPGLRSLGRDTHSSRLSSVALAVEDIPDELVLRVLNLYS